MIANFFYDSEISLAQRKTVHSEIFARIAKFLLWLQNFLNPCKIFVMHSENLACLLLPPALPLHPVQLLFHHFHLTFPHFWVMKSPRILSFSTNTKPSLMTEVPKTCKTTKNNLETKSVALNRPAHANWLNLHD